MSSGLGTFEGLAAFRNERKLFGFFEEHVWGPAEILSLGHGVVFVALAMRGRVAGGTGPVQANAAWVYEWMDDKIERVANYEVDDGRPAA